MAEPVGTVSVEVIPELNYSKVIESLNILSEAYLDLYLQTRKTMFHLEEANSAEH